MIHENALVENYWTVECFRQGKLIWKTQYANLITTAGCTKLLDAAFVTGLAAPLWYVGLISTGAVYAVGDTMGSHAGWTELTNYSQTARPQWTGGTVSSGSVDNSAAKASFTITSAATVAGAFLADSSTKGGTSGTLYGEGSFSSGEQAVIGGDIVNITVTLTAGVAAGSGFMPIKEQVFGEFHP